MLLNIQYINVVLIIAHRSGSAPEHVLTAPSQLRFENPMNQTTNQVRVLDLNHAPSQNNAALCSLDLFSGVIHTGGEVVIILANFIPFHFNHYILFIWLLSLLLYHMLRYLTLYIRTEWVCTYSIADVFKWKIYFN